MAVNYTTVYIAADTTIFTSAINVQAHQRVNTCILIGSNVARVLDSGASYVSPTVSTFSGIITLQRRLPDDVAGLWRDVDAWIITAAEGLAAEDESISITGEPEPAQYRLGCKDTEYYAGGVTVRIASPE